MGCGLGSSSENPIGVGRYVCTEVPARQNRGMREKVDAGGFGWPKLKAGVSPRGPEGFDEAAKPFQQLDHSPPRTPNQTVMTGIIKVARSAIGSFRPGSLGDTGDKQTEAI